MDVRKRWKRIFVAAVAMLACVLFIVVVARIADGAPLHHSSHRPVDRYEGASGRARPASPPTPLPRLMPTRWHCRQRRCPCRCSRLHPDSPALQERLLPFRLSR